MKNSFHFMKRIICIFSVCAFLVIGAGTAAIADDDTGSVKAQSATNNGLVVIGAVSGATDLFGANTKNLLPYDEREFSVKLSNNSGKAVTLYIRADETSDAEFAKMLGFIDDVASYDAGSLSAGQQAELAQAKTVSAALLSQIRMRVKLSGASDYLYAGPSDGKGTEGGTALDKDSDAVTGGYIKLGTLSNGADTYLNVNISVPGMGNEYAKAEALVDWVFLAQFSGGDNPPGGGDDDDDDDDGGGDNPGGGDDPGSDIPDGDVPTGDNPGGDTDGDVIIDIPEEGTPLAPPDTVIVIDDPGELPLTGAFVGSGAKAIGSIVMVLLATSLVLVVVKKRKSLQ